MPTYPLSSLFVLLILSFPFSLLGGFREGVQTPTESEWHWGMPSNNQLASPPQVFAPVAATPTGFQQHL